MGLLTPAQFGVTKRCFAGEETTKANVVHHQQQTLVRHPTGWATILRPSTLAQASPPTLEVHLSREYFPLEANPTWMKRTTRGSRRVNESICVDS
jgi:hypothetical protein